MHEGSLFVVGIGGHDSRRVELYLVQCGETVMDNAVQANVR